MNIKSEIFVSMCDRIDQQKDSLPAARRIKFGGIEAWFKVEVLTALGQKVKHVSNRGPDLELQGNIFLELKASTNYRAAWITSSLLRQIADPKWRSCYCLFLAEGSNSDTKIKKLIEKYRVQVLDYCVINDGFGDWLIGLVEPVPG